VILDGTPHTIVGVMPPGFTYPANVDVWTAITPDSVVQPGRSWVVEGVGRLREGVTFAQASAEWRLLAGRVAASDTLAAGSPGAAVVPLTVGHGSDPLLTLVLAAIATLFIIMCANVQGLVALRVLRRRRELTVRAALGATHMNILRLACAEIGVLVLISSVVGLAVVLWGRRILQARLGSAFPELYSVSMDPAVIGIGIGLTLVVFSALVAGYLWVAGTADLRSALHDGGVGGTARAGRLRSRLVIVQVALALALSATAGALARSFRRAADVDLGADSERVTAVSVDLSGTSYDDPAQARLLVNKLLDAIQLATHAQMITAWRSTPALLWNRPGEPTMTIEGRDILVDASKCRAATCIAPWSSQDVSPEFFAALGVRPIRGRVFSVDDGPGAMPVAIVNEVAAARWWPNENAIGRRFKFGSRESPSPWLTVVGVVRMPYPLDHMGYRLGPAGGPGYPLVFRPLGQTVIDSRATLRNWMWSRKLWIGVIPSPGAGAGVPREIRASIERLAPEVEIGPIGSLRRAMIDQTAWRHVRVNARLARLFAAVGVGIALLGVIGITAEDVRARARELATRMALGASPRHVVVHVVGRSGALALMGVAVGLGTCVAANAYLVRKFTAFNGFVRGERFTSGLMGTSLLDPAVMIPLGLGLLVVCVLSSLIPAVMAARLDPVIPLRAE
jgi:putative ABC transport system permease protein